MATWKVEFKVGGTVIVTVAAEGQQDAQREATEYLGDRLKRVGMVGWTAKCVESIKVAK